MIFKIIILLFFCYNLCMIVMKKRKYSLEVPKKIKIFNLGSSHGYFAFNYKGIEKGTNLAQISQTFYYDYTLLKTFFNRIENGAVCFIPISYFSFSNKRKTWQKEDMINYYKILPLKEFKGKEKIICFIFKYLPIIWSLKKKIDKKKRKSIAKSEQRILNQVEKLKKEKTEISIVYLNKTIKKLKEKRIRIILITTPFQKDYNRYFSENLLNEKFYSEIEKIKNKESIEYYDFSHAYEAFNREEYFDDNDHLNEKGSKVFMKEIIKIIKNKVR